MSELETECRRLREQIKETDKEVEDLRGQLLHRNVEEGKRLLDSTDVKETSLIAEIQQLSENEVNFWP